jgi:anti-anti-sigma factor
VQLGEQLPFVLRLDRDPTLTVITLDEAVAALKADRPEEVLLDLNGLSFVDSSGIRALLRTNAVCEESGCRLVLLRGSAQVQRTLTVARLIDRFCFAD